MKAALLGIAFTLTLASAASASFTLSLDGRTPLSATPAGGMLAKAEADAAQTSGPQNFGGATGFDGAATGSNRYALDISGLRAKRIDITGKLYARQERAKVNGDVIEQTLIVPEPASLAVWSLVGLTSLAAGVSRRRQGVRG
jgi:hypothetical protein